MNLIHKRKLIMDAAKEQDLFHIHKICYVGDDNDTICHLTLMRNTTQEEYNRVLEEFKFKISDLIDGYTFINPKKRFKIKEDVL